MSLSVFAAAREQPNALAIVGPDVQITFEDLAQRAEAALGWLSAQGVDLSPGQSGAAIDRAGTGASLSRVAVVGRPALDVIELMVALISAGVPFVALHPGLSQAQRDALSRRAGVSLVVESGWRSASQGATPEPRVWQPALADDELPLAVMPTSGSSGDPKAVILSRRAFVASARASAENLGWQPGDRWLANLPLSHVGGLSILTRCLLARRTLAVEPLRPNESAVHGVVRAIRERAVTMLSLVPTVLAQLLDLMDRPPTTLRMVLLGGASASVELVTRAHSRGWPVVPTYGLTETCSQVATERLGNSPPSDGSVGPVLPGTEVRITRGVIEVRGPTLFSGYLSSNQPALDSDGWFSTEDLGRITPAGRLIVLGRKDDVIVSGGENVHPVEIESVLQRHASVRRVCVFGVADERWGRVVAAAISPASAREHSSELSAMMRRELADHQRPRLVAFVDELNTTSTGKVDRAATARRVAGELERWS
jgi:O-succinylbenzoic acid--CoA ligase